ncbi:MAG: penicillin-binding protein 2 [Candidatus Aenigmarchaeota archaeon]|nr:penicillin-binding protein 2 [Candidatus Aenigmarchaeota archaeon]
MLFREEPNLKKIRSKRLSFLFFLVCFFTLIIIARLFYVQIIKHKFYQSLARDTYQFGQTVLPKRGEFFTLNKPVNLDLLKKTFNQLKKDDTSSVAINRQGSLLYAVPAQIEQPIKTIEQVGPFLNWDEQEIKQRQEKMIKLTKEKDFYEPLAHRLSDFSWKEIEALNLLGIKKEEEDYRFYPEDELFSHLLGFVSYKDDIAQGQYGLEEYFDQELTRGQDVILTLDQTIQFTARQYLLEAIDKFDAIGGTVVVMEVGTGRILALVNNPDFNPNDYGSIKDYQIFSNSAISKVYEPGSIFKVITMAAALNEQKVTPNTYYEDKGSVKVGPKIITNSTGESYGWQTMIQVLEKSLNTGAVFVAQQLTPTLFKNYISRFGFGSFTNIESVNEQKGNINNLDKREPIYLANISFGQGISVTPVQLITAFGAIANQGKLVSSHLVEGLTNLDGTISWYQPKVVKQVITSQAATDLTAMMVSVVKNGFCKSAGVAGYLVAGKSGTAQVPSKEGGGYSEDTIHSFIGFAPANQPRFVVLVKLDQPQKGDFSANTVGPFFSKLTSFILDYLQISPSD